MGDRYARARAIGRDLQESDEYVAAVNESAARAERREKIARGLATTRMFELTPAGRDQDVVVDDDATVEYRDGGYWVAARVWVEADEVEDEMEEVPNGTDAV